MVSRVLKFAAVTQGGIATSFQDAWTVAPCIASVKPVTGHARAGLCRRPVYHDRIWEDVVKCLEAAHQQGGTKETLGVGHKRLGLLAHPMYLSVA